MYFNGNASVSGSVSCDKVDPQGATASSSLLVNSDAHICTVKDDFFVERRTETSKWSELSLAMLLLLHRTDQRGLWSVKRLKRTPQQLNSVRLFLCYSHFWLVTESAGSHQTFSIRLHLSKQTQAVGLQRCGHSPGREGRRRHAVTLHYGKCRI